MRSRRSFVRFAVAGALAALLAGVSGCGSGPTAGGRLRELSSLEQFRAVFDDASGSPRLLLLFSPT